MLRRSIAGVLIALSSGSQVFAQGSYPNKPIKMVIAFAPGGPVDLTVRPVGQKLGEVLGQPVIMDYKVGGTATIGTDYVAKSPADGYTLLIAASPHTINPSTQKSLPYDTLRDFTGVSPIGRSDIVLVSNPKLPVNNVQELIALAKAKPGKLNFASSGTGGPLHLGGELLKMVAGIDMVHIPYKGGGPALQDVVAGTADIAFVAAPPAVAQIKAGKVKLLAIASLKRTEAFPDTPTVEEAGFPKFEITAAYGIVVPAGTPAATISRLNGALEKTLATAEIRQAFNRMGLAPWWMTAEQYTDWIREDIERWAAVAKAIKYQRE